MGLKGLKHKLLSNYSPERDGADQLTAPPTNPARKIKSNLFCHKFGTQYNNEFALYLAGQTGDNFLSLIRKNLLMIKKPFNDAGFPAFGISNRLRSRQLKHKLSNYWPERDEADQEVSRVRSHNYGIDKITRHASCLQ